MNDIILISIFALFIVYVSSIYNKVIRKKNETDKAFGTVEILLKKRFDLLPNLVDIAKQYAMFEASVITEIAKINERLTENPSVSEKIELYNSLNKQVDLIMVVVHKYPELKTTNHFIKLQAAWNETEEQISEARRYYNAAVSDYNNAIQTFPANALINKSTYPERRYLKFDEDETANISAKTLFNDR